jgi:hypothetical protein
MGNIDNNLQIALDKLKEDGVTLELLETGKGDNYLTIYSKNLKTKIGANDLGFSLIEQVSKD